MSLISPNFAVNSIILFLNFGQGGSPKIVGKSPGLVLVQARKRPDMTENFFFFFFFFFFLKFKI